MELDRIVDKCSVISIRIINRVVQAAQIAVRKNAPIDVLNTFNFQKIGGLQKESIVKLLKETNAFGQKGKGSMKNCIQKMTDHLSVLEKDYASSFMFPSASNVFSVIL